MEAPELRALLENFVSSSNDIAYATVVNADAKGISAGRIEPDAFLQRELDGPMTPPTKAAPIAARPWWWAAESQPGPSCWSARRSCMAGGFWE